MKQSIFLSNTIHDTIPKSMISPKRSIVLHSVILIAFLAFSNLSCSQNNALFPIIENGKTGFINYRGETIITPIYHEAGDFSEGLASVRIDGRYGYINTKGKIVLPPKYDYAGSFTHGIAAVYIEGEVVFIDKKGTQVLPDSFKSIRFINEHLCIYTTNNDKSGLFNIKEKSFITTPKKQKFQSFTQECVIVEIEKDDKRHYAVMSLSGEVIVDFGIYSTIRDFVEGYALVRLYNPDNGKPSIDGVIDTEGNLLFKRPEKNHTYIWESFHDGFASINLYKYWISNKPNSYSTKHSYEGYVDLQGNVVFDDTLITYTHPFSNNRAFIRDHDRNYYVVDTKFNRLNTKPFKNILNQNFEDGYAIVQSEKGWGIIDVDMNYVVAPAFESIHPMGIIDDLFFFGEKQGQSYSLYGLKNLDGKTLIPPIIQDVKEGFKNGVLRAFSDSKLTYFNKSGEIIWQEKPTETDPQPHKTLNITYMNRGYFYAYSKGKNENSGGWAISNNVPKPVSTTPEGEWLLLKEDNLKLYITNYSTEEFQFNAQDSRLNLKLQAKDQDGQWKDIEYLPSSWCGNSYHTITLPQNHYWEFDLPKYEGDFETLLRAQLQYIHPKTKKEQFIYSNEFKGSVNPGQFWRKPDYTPNGIMDPYDN